MNTYIHVHHIYVSISMDYSNIYTHINGLFAYIYTHINGLFAYIYTQTHMSTHMEVTGGKTDDIVVK